MEPTDIQLMLRVRDGDLEAYRLIVERYRRPLQRFLSALAPGQADDAVQETLLRLWLLREQYEPTGRFSTYLFQIARNHALNARKRRENEIRRDTESASVSIETPEDSLMLRHRNERVMGAIRSLPEIYRSVFEMSHKDGLKYAEIGARLGIPVGTVKSRMAEAVRKLRHALSSDE
jgi:RNA polymerase sigma-70 factor (ECF subfamily)